MKITQEHIDNKNRILITLTGRDLVMEVLPIEISPNGEYFKFEDTDPDDWWLADHQFNVWDILPPKNQ